MAESLLDAHGRIFGNSTKKFDAIIYENPWGQLFKAGLALILGESLNHFFSFCISTPPIVSKLEDAKLTLIHLLPKVWKGMEV